LGLRGRTRRALRAPRGSSAGVVAVIGLAALAAAAGLVLLLGAVAPPRPDVPRPAGTLVAGDLQLQVQNTGWITHDDVGGPTPASIQNGFTMPASMMPGLPDHGTHRLYLEAVLSNVGQGAASFAPREFSVRAPSGRTWPLDDPPTFAAGSLQPGQTRSLDMLFDVPDTVTRLDLAWAHDGADGSISIDSRPPPPHQHG
jgi:hypothetical protein